MVSARARAEVRRVLQPVIFCIFHATLRHGDSGARGRQKASSSGPSELAFGPLSRRSGCRPGRGRWRRTRNSPKASPVRSRRQFLHRRLIFSYPDQLGRISPVSLSFRDCPNADPPAADRRGDRRDLCQRQRSGSAPPRQRCHRVSRYRRAAYRRPDGRSTRPVRLRLRRIVGRVPRRGGARVRRRDAGAFDLKAVSIVAVAGPRLQLSTHVGRGLDCRPGNDSVAAVIGSKGLAIAPRFLSAAKRRQEDRGHLGSWCSISRPRSLPCDVHFQPTSVRWPAATLWVDLTCSPHRLRTAAICAQQTAARGRVGTPRDRSDCSRLMQIRTTRNG